MMVMVLVVVFIQCHRLELSSGAIVHHSDYNLCDVSNAPFNPSLICYCDSTDDFQATDANCIIVSNISEGNPMLTSFHSLSQLKFLKLSDRLHGSLTFIPSKVLSFLPRLVSLKIVNAAIADIPSGSFSGLEEAEDIDLQDNKIETIEAYSFSSVPKLRTLTLSENLLSKIPRNAFVDLPSLRKLYLDRNAIQHIDDASFSSLTNLEELDLNQNELQTLSSGVFIGLLRLSHLDLQGNAIRKLSEDVFKDLRNLKYLDLSENEIRHLNRNVFYSLKNLVSLKLNENRIAVLPKQIFQNVPKLLDVDLRGNKLITLSYETILPIINNFQSSSMYFRISENNFTCDCSLMWIREVANTTLSKNLRDSLMSLKCLSTIEDHRRLLTGGSGSYIWEYMEFLNSPEFCSHVLHNKKIDGSNAKPETKSTRKNVSKFVAADKAFYPNDMNSDGSDKEYNKQQRQEVMKIDSSVKYKSQERSVDVDAPFSRNVKNKGNILRFQTCVLLIVFCCFEYR